MNFLAFRLGQVQTPLPQDNNADMLAELQMVQTLIRLLLK